MRVMAFGYRLSAHEGRGEDQKGGTGKELKARCLMQTTSILTGSRAYELMNSQVDQLRVMAFEAYLDFIKIDVSSRVNGGFQCAATREPDGLNCGQPIFSKPINFLDFNWLLY